MAKFPEPGKVKTRLAESLGDDTALEIYKDLLQNIYSQCIHKNRYKFGVIVSPENKLNDFQKFFSGFDFYFSQTEGDLGKRMKNAFYSLFEKKKADKVILIGSDIPNLNNNIISKAFKELDENDIVYGPTEDGGYYLIGMKKVYQQLFEHIKWGVSDVLSTSLDIADKNNISYYLLEILSDLDTFEDMFNFPELYEKYINKKTGI